MDVQSTSSTIAEMSASRLSTFDVGAALIELLIVPTKSSTASAIHFILNLL